MRSRHRHIFPGSHPPSIFGTDELNYCVRDGNRWDLIAIGTGKGQREVILTIYMKHPKGWFNLVYRKREMNLRGSQW